MNLKEKIWENIKMIRKNKNISQENLAQKIGVKRPYLSNIENWLVNLTVDTLEKISIALEVEITVLFS